MKRSIVMNGFVDSMRWSPRNGDENNIDAQIRWSDSGLFRLHGQEPRAPMEFDQLTGGVVLPGVDTTPRGLIGKKARVTITVEIDE